LAEVNLTKNLPPARVENKSSTLGIGYLSKVEMGFTVCLKSLQTQTLVLSGLRTATIGAAYSATLTGSKVPSVTKWFSSFSTLSHRKYSTVHALQYFG